MIKLYKPAELFGLVDVTKVEYTNLRVTIECTDIPKEYDLKTLTDPNRIYVDVFNSNLAVSNRTIEVQDDLVKAIHLEQFAETTVRIVIDSNRKPDQAAKLCTEQNILCIDL